jgi:hypothetical protein
MTDWSKKVKEAVARAEGERRAQQVRDRAVRDEEDARQADIRRVIDEIVRPVLQSAAAALTEHTGRPPQLEALADPQRGIEFHVWSLKQGRVRISEGPSSVFKLEDSEGRLYYSETYPNEHQLSPEAVEPSEITTAWVEERLEEFIHKALAA